MEAKLIRSLERELQKEIEGEVRFDDGSRALYATDSSNYRQVPIGVVVPKNQDDIKKTVSLCSKYEIPILSRGGGTSLAGQCCNAAVVMDMSKYVNRIIHIDPDKKIAHIEPGVVAATLSKAANKFQLTWGPDPSTHEWCTLGGMMGNNSCGAHSVMAGRTDQNVLELKILTYEGLEMWVGSTSSEQLEKIIHDGGRKGEIYQRLKRFRDKYAELIEEKYPDIPRRVSGYNLPWLLEKNGFDVAKALVGSESTLVTILEAKVRLVYNPPFRCLVILGYPSVYEAGDHIQEIMAHQPIALEGADDVLIGDMQKKHMGQEYIELLPPGKGWLYVEFGGDSQDEAKEKACRFMEVLKGKSDAPTMRLYDNPKTQKTIHSAREMGLGATARVPSEKDTWEGWEDSAVPPEKVGNYLRDLRKLFKKYDYQCALYGHFGQGCIHTRIDFDLYTSEGINRYRSFIHEAADLVVSYGGCFSGEHGDGQSKAEMYPKLFGDELVRGFKEFKKIWDPRGKMNPGKMGDFYTPVDNLRLGPQFNPPQVTTHFQFPGDDEGSFSRATLRCVGVGKCRRHEEGTMCPSYMVTKEEKHSTRGRAHLLFEMLQGEVIGKNKWKDEAVKEALDLCLSCKGCKADCPMNVDMATYKAEFLAHFYEGRLRPRSAYAFGLIYWWSRAATHFPNFVNFLTQRKPFSSIAKWMAGMPKERSIPKFAKQNYRSLFSQKATKPTSEKKVLLWVDTFNNYFHPHVAEAATDVLEKIGWTVIVPKTTLCCGRPLYDYGMLDEAKKILRKILHELREEIHAGIPIVGLEPSCVSVFRDELGNLFPSDLDAKRLKDQVLLLSEFLQKYEQDYHFQPIQKKALVHGHCHHKSVLNFEQESAFLKRLGLDFRILESGCCGMAGSFGFEKDHYDVSVKCAERVLLPEIIHADRETLIISNGFSCKEQIEQLTNRKVHHLAEVIQMSLTGSIQQSRPQG